MSKEPVIVAPSRVRCARCNRFVFRGSVCKCCEPRVSFVPQTDGTLGMTGDGYAAPKLGGASTLGSPLTARPMWRKDEDGHTSSVDAIPGAP